MVIRPMRPEDVPVAEALSLAAYTDSERFEPPATDPAPSRAPPPHGPGSGSPAPRTCWRPTRPAAGWPSSRRAGRLRGLLPARPALAAGVVRRAVGAPGPRHRPAAARRRPVALPRLPAGDAVASSDPKAFRRYRRAGFTLHPQLHLAGVPDRTASPSSSTSARALRRLRPDGLAGPAAPRGRHGSDHPCSPRCTAWWSPTTPPARATPTCATTARPCCSRPPTGVRRPGCSGRRSPRRRPATRSSRHVTPANEWAVDVGLEARLSASTRGYLALRGMRPPMPYLHHGSLL